MYRTVPTYTNLYEKERYNVCHILRTMSYKFLHFFGLSYKLYDQFSTCHTIYDNIWRPHLSYKWHRKIDKFVIYNVYDKTVWCLAKIYDDHIKRHIFVLFCLMSVCHIFYAIYMTQNIWRPHYKNPFLFTYMTICHIVWPRLKRIKFRDTLGQRCATETLTAIQFNVLRIFFLWVDIIAYLCMSILRIIR